MNGCPIRTVGTFGDCLSLFHLPKVLSDSMRHALLIAICVLAEPLAMTQRARAGDPAIGETQAHVVVVVGASGTPEYGEQFAQWAVTWRDVAEQAAASLTMIGPSQPSQSNPGGDSSDGDSNDRDQLRETLVNLPRTTRGDLWIVLIGHGTFAQNAAKFNLRGPDVTATELAEWLKDTRRPIVVVNCASASGPFINRLSGEGRVIVTATKSGTEQNLARFGEFIAKSIVSPDSDLDHDDEVSIHEAFLRASAEVQQFYNAAGRISTEHALIDDNGDGLGTPAKMFRGTRPIGKPKANSKLDGLEASKRTLTPAVERLSFTQSELDKRRELETQLAELRKRHLSRNGDQLDETAYDAELEPLMVELAKLYRTAETRQKQIQADSQ